MELRNNSRILILGPAPPFRGGISTFANNLAFSLHNMNAEVALINFIDQYPKVLFHGGDQIDIDVSPCVPMHRAFTPYLPFTWRKAIKIINSYNPDFIIISYWLPLFVPAYWWICSKSIHSRIFVLAHNVISHEKWPLGKFLRTKLFNIAEKIIVLSQASLNDLVNEYRDQFQKKSILAFHPIDKQPEFDDMQPSISEPEKAMLFFGLIKDYKGLDLLLAALSIAKQSVPDIRLIIAGAVYGSFQKYNDIIDNLDIGSNIELHLHYVSDLEMRQLFNRAKFCILPYRTATQSGVIANSYANKTPVIVTNVGGLSEYVEEGKTGFIVNANDPMSLADALIKGWKIDDTSYMQENISRYVDTYSWERLAKMIISL